MVSRSLVRLVSALLLFGSASAGTQTQEGVGSTTENVTINAGVGNACVLSIPSGPLTTSPVLYWTSAGTATAGGTINVKCNMGTLYTVNAAAPTQLFLNGVAGGPSVPLSFSGGTSDGETVADQNAENAAATAAGQNYPFTFTAGPAQQDDPAGMYSGVVVVTLNVLGDGEPVFEGPCPPGWIWDGPTETCQPPLLPGPGFPGFPGPGFPGFPGFPGV